MKKAFVSTLASVVLFAGSAAPAFASMNFIGEGYKVPPACTNVDNGVYEIVNGMSTVVGCWTPEAMAKSKAAAAARTYHFGVGQSVVLKDGRTETCPVWFIFSAGCVIDPALVR